MSFGSGFHDLLPLFIACALAAGAGAFAGGFSVFALEARRRDEDVLAGVNVSVAGLAALLGKLINFKKDRVFPALAALEGEGEGAAAIPPAAGVAWPEPLFSSGLDHDRLFRCSGADLDIVQLAHMLDYNLAELSHLVAGRNAVAGAAAEGEYVRMIARHVDENLFFADRLIEKLPAAARLVLPRSLHGKIAALGLMEEARPLVPPRDFIRDWVK